MQNIEPKKKKKSKISHQKKATFYTTNWIFEMNEQNLNKIEIGSRYYG